jgi:hypothetical protein
LGNSWALIQPLKAFFLIGFLNEGGESDFSFIYLFICLFVYFNEAKIKNHEKKKLKKTKR